MTADETTQTQPAAGAQAPAVTPEFKSAFDELAVKREAVTETPAAEAPAESDQAEKDKVPEEGKEAAGDKSPSAADADKGNEGDQGDKRGTKKVQQVDLSVLEREDMTPEQRAALDAAKDHLHRYYSDEGRVSRLAKEKARLEADLAATGIRKDATKVPFSQTEEGKRMLEDLPETKPLVERQDQLEAEADKRRRDEQTTAFQAKHPDFLQHKAAFLGWIKEQPPHLQAIAERNGKGGISNSEEAIKLVNLFKVEKGLAEPAGDGEQPEPAPTNKVESRRQAQLEAARKTPPSKTVDATSAPAGNSEFAFFANKKDETLKKRA